MADENSGNWLAVFIVKFIKFDVIDSDDSRFLQSQSGCFRGVGLWALAIEQLIEKTNK